MSTSITSTLYHWMKEKRIIDPVARRLGMSGSTLAAELRSAPHQAKLGADRLVPLFEAIRETQYAGELDGIIKPFIRELESRHVAKVPVKSQGEHVRELMKCVGDLLSASAQIKDSGSAQEIERLRTKVRTEIIPAAYMLDDILARRVARAEKKSRSTMSVLTPTTAKAGV